MSTEQQSPHGDRSTAAKGGHSLSERYPDYRVELIPCPMPARARHGDLVLAESDRCLIVRETRHADRLYFPEEAVRWELFTASDHQTHCPFKGDAGYWSLTACNPAEENLVWTYRTPLEAVAGLKGHVCFYQDRVSLELDEQWPDAHVVTRKFPVWGDQHDVVRLLDVQPATEEGSYVAPAFWDTEPVDFEGRPLTRNVVEGGQLLGQAIVAATRAAAPQRVTSGYIIFARPAVFHLPLELKTELPRKGRTFSTVRVQLEQAGKVCSNAMFLLDAGGEEVLHGTAEMPAVPGPLESPHLDLSVTGRELRVVDGAYDTDPERVGPPEIMTWCRWRDAPAEHCLHEALLAQSTTHWTIAAAMRPHPGISEAQAHKTLSTAPVSVSIAFHDEVDVTEWLLYANRAIYAGRGQAQGEGHVFTQDGFLVASYTVQAMIRPFPQSLKQRDPKKAM